MRSAELPYSATHILQHASLTEFYDFCKDLLQTAKVAGHRDLRATEKYAKVRDDRVVQTQKEMDKKLSSLFPSSGASTLTTGDKGRQIGNYEDPEFFSEVQLIGMIEKA